jgi:FKBP-type peptidyl-prolyl cis-trans isomerase FkpA
MYQSQKGLLFCLALIFLILGCRKDDQNQLDRDLEIIREWLSDHNLEASATSSGLHYIIDNPGFGNHPTSISQVTVAYSGKLTNGFIFDQSPTTGIRFGLNQVIPGWTEGIQLFREGGRGKLIIPSVLAYGARGAGDIPPNSVLIFDIHLIQVH